MVLLGVECLTPFINYRYRPCGLELDPTTIVYRDQMRLADMGKLSVHHCRTEWTLHA